MAKVSLDDLRNGAAISLPERSYSLCIRRDLMAQVDEMLADRQRVSISQAVDPENLPPERKGGKPQDEALQALLAEVEDNTGELRLRGVTDGEWQRFKNEHPPREGNQRDGDVAYGLCNVDDLVLDLPRYVHAWNGDVLKDGEWERIFAPNVAGGDLKAIANLVVHMQEAADDPKFGLRVLLDARTSSDADTSPEQ